MVVVYGPAIDCPKLKYGPDKPLCDILLVGCLHIRLVDYSILHGSVDLRVTEYFLHLLDGHTFVDSTGCHGTSEFVRMDAIQMQTAVQLT